MLTIGQKIHADCIDRPACDKATQSIERAKETAKINEHMKVISRMTDNITYRALYEPDKGEQFVLLIAAGLTVEKAAEAAGIDPPVIVYYWIVRNPDFAQRYLEACQAKCMKWADQLVSLADECPADIPAVAKCRQQIDVRKWMLSKIVPKVFGDKVQVNHDVKGSPQVNIILPGKGGSTANLPPAPPAPSATINASPKVIDSTNQPGPPLKRKRGRPKKATQPENLPVVTPEPEK